MELNIQRLFEAHNVRLLIHPVQAFLAHLHIIREEELGSQKPRFVVGEAASNSQQ